MKDFNDKELVAGDKVAVISGRKSNVYLIVAYVVAETEFYIRLTYNEHDRHTFLRSKDKIVSMV